jgi:hypothetical protein
MKCKEAKTKLHLWIDNQLHNDEEVKLSAHLSSCKSCRDFKNDLLTYKKLILGQNELIPCRLDPISMNSENEKNKKKVLEMISLVAAACFGILIGMSLFQISNFNNRKQENIIAETQHSEQQLKQQNVIKETYYNPMSFMVHYDDFFFTNNEVQAQECSTFPTE